MDEVALDKVRRRSRQVDSPISRPRYLFAQKTDYMKLENELGKIEQLGSIKSSFSNQLRLDKKTHFVKWNGISIRVLNEIF